MDVQQHRHSHIMMPPAGFIKELIMKFESGFQNALPRRHGSVASRAHDPDSKRRSAPPRTVSISDLGSSDVNGLQNKVSVISDEYVSIQGNNDFLAPDHATEGRSKVSTEDEKPPLDKHCRPADDISTKISAIDKSNSIDPLTVLPQPLSTDVGEASIQSSFLRIPVELRLIIYNYSFPSSRTTGEEETIIYCTPDKLRVIGPFHSQICRVNRQVYEETKKLLYGRTLVFLSREALMKFSTTRTSQLGSYIRSICIKTRVTNWVPAIKTLMLPHKASLKVEWPIERELWSALLDNKTLQYRKVRCKTEGGENCVVFEPFKLENTACKAPSYEVLEATFRVISG